MKLMSSKAVALAGALALTLAGSPAVADQPDMHHGLWQLEAAKVQLEKAEADKDGHRVKAIKLTDRAIAEVREGIKWAEEHQNAPKGPPNTPPKPGPDTTKYEGQIYMHAAHYHLAHAEEWLGAGTDNHGGHRVKALELVREALHEVYLGVMAGDEWEKQPFMRSALHHCQEAKKDLAKAAEDHQGLRDKALKLDGEALKEIDEGEKWAAAHPVEAKAPAHEKPPERAPKAHGKMPQGGAMRPLQPNILAAHFQLKRAEYALEHGSSDHGGFRVKALVRVREALTELNRRLEG